MKMNLRSKGCGSVWIAVVAATLLLGSTGCHPKTIRAEGTAKNARQDGVVKYREGDYRAAKKLFQAAIDAKPGDFRQHYWLGVTELQMGRPVAAQTELEYAFSVRQDDPAWTPRILDAIAESIYRQGRLDALYTFLEDTAARYQATGDYLRQAKYQVKTGDLDGAKLSYRKAMFFWDGQNAEPYLAVADFYIAVNDVPNAIKALRYATYVEPDNAQAADRFRQLGVVPGPTLSLEPPKPDIFLE